MLILPWFYVLLIRNKVSMFVEPYISADNVKYEITY